MLGNVGVTSHKSTGFRMISCRSPGRREVAGVDVVMHANAGEDRA